MPFRCKCGRTFERLESFGSHTSGCAPFHHRRISTSDVFSASSKTTDKSSAAEKQGKLTIDTTDYFSQPREEDRKKLLLVSPTLNKRTASASSVPRSAPASGFMMPTALSIQNIFEGVSRRRSMSHNIASTCD